MRLRVKRARVNLDEAFPELSGMQWKYAIYRAEELIKYMLGASQVTVTRDKPSLSWAKVEVEYAPS